MTIELTKSQLIDLVTGMIDDGIRKNRYETYEEWQAAVERLIVMNMKTLSPAHPWDSPAFVSGHSAGVAWWTTMKPGIDCPEPQPPYIGEAAAALWARGFKQGKQDASDSFEQRDSSPTP